MAGANAPDVERAPGAGVRSHHRPDGGFRNPWPTANGDRQPSVWRWWWERLFAALPPNPRPEDFPRHRPQPKRQRAAAGELNATWLGHSSFLLQIGGLNVLTDPQLSVRASPFAAVGPKRLTAPGLRRDELPPIDAVILSHDHYDHLDEPTVRHLVATHDDDLTWFVPLRLGEWLRQRGARSVVELDWWESAAMDGLELRFLPAQHWSSRAHVDSFRRLWGSWSIRAPEGASVYFGGDSGWFPGYAEIGERAGPFDLVLMPIGAYEPRWFMRTAHMNPEEAVQAYGELGGSGVFGGMHWGTFRLTDEDPLEPPRRCRAAWSAAGFPAERLWIPAHGETRILRAG